eukprot:GHVQ01032231.1.p3 GENE.GHVQ01032231.1~~GHVQ01032231.1.p3  ORF type:complete len:112 (+),score=18.83 GHVQ01032231.1:386-721(+)
MLASSFSRLTRPSYPLLRLAYTSGYRGLSADVPAVCSRKGEVGEGWKLSLSSYEEYERAGVRPENVLLAEAAMSGFTTRQQKAELCQQHDNAVMHNAVWGVGGGCFVVCVG